MATTCCSHLIEGCRNVWDSGYLVCLDFGMMSKADGGPDWVLPAAPPTQHTAPCGCGNGGRRPPARCLAAMLTSAQPLPTSTARYAIILYVVRLPKRTRILYSLASHHPLCCSAVRHHRARGAPGEPRLPGHVHGLLHVSFDALMSFDALTPCFDGWSVRTNC